jgi:hypothetical protein
MTDLDLNTPMSEVPTSFTLQQHPPRLLAELRELSSNMGAKHTTPALKQRIDVVEYHLSGPTALSFVGRVLRSQIGYATFVEIDASLEIFGGQQTRIEPGKLYSWWNEQTSIPAVRQMAFDPLSIPAMSAETERVFSDTKLTIPPQRTRLGADIVEAEECERAWLKAGL